jgi:FkbM family methyltransferase
MGLAHRLLGSADFDEMAVALAVLPDRGVMVDVGAHQGSSLLPFAATGWQVWAFEPDPANRQILVDAVDAFDVHVDPRAVDKVTGRTVDLYTSEVSTGISSLLNFHAGHRPSASVETVRLDDFLRENDVGAVDFLKVDAEGHDLRVLETFPWNSDRPAMVICEFEDRKTRLDCYDHTDLGDFLSSLDYHVFLSEWQPVVEYGGLHRWRHVHRYPVGLAHADAWGNFLAVHRSLTPRLERALRSSERELRMRRATAPLRAARARARRQLARILDRGTD